MEQVPWEPSEYAVDPAGQPPSLVGVRVAYEDPALPQIRQAGGR